MASWAEQLGDRIKGKLGGVGSYGFDDALNEAIRETIEEAARRCCDADVIEVRGGGSYYAQLGDGRASLNGAAADILAMLNDEGAAK